MFKPKRSLLIFACLLLSLTGCAKREVRDFPPKPLQEGPSVAFPEKPPAPVYDKPMAKIGPSSEEIASGTQTQSYESPLLAAVAPLEEKAASYLLSGDLEKAQATTERAIRIDPGNPQLWRLMAEIALAGEKYDQARQFAGKSNLYAKGDDKLRARNYRIIAEAFRRKGMDGKARKALDKARQLESR